MNIDEQIEWLERCVAKFGKSEGAQEILSTLRALKNGDVTTSQAHSALILLSAIITTLEKGETYHVVPEDLPWMMVILKLMPQMPLADER